MAKTYNEILEELLARVPDDLNKEADSPVYVAVSPVAAMSAEQRVYNENIFDATMPDTARGEEQTRIYTGFGIPRNMATAAIRKGVFMDANGNLADIPIPFRFGANGIAYKTIAKIEVGVFQLECESAGTVGNNYFGPILPLDESITLGSAELEDVIVAGVENEEDEHYRARFYQAVNTRVTSGNVAWYEQEIRDINGVGDVKVFPTPENQGGRVHGVIVGPGNAAASQQLIDRVKSTIDPEPSGSGTGRAPIDHHLTISTVSDVTINIAGSLWLLSGYDYATALPHISASIADYLKEISFKDDTVRIAFIESAIISSEGVKDASNITINGGVGNIILADDWTNYEVPKLGQLQFTQEG